MEQTSSKNQKYKAMFSRTSSADLPANICLPPITQFQLYSYAGYSKLVNPTWSDLVEKAIEKYLVLVFFFSSLNQGTTGQMRWEK